MKKIIHNLIYQSSYQFLTILLPIITVPIVSNALGPKGIGQYNYVYSIVSYFLLFAGLGLQNYGAREISIVRGDKKKLTRKFWELTTLNICVASVTIFFYLIFILNIENPIYFTILGVSLLGSLFDITWFFVGIEEFKHITFANFIVKIIGLLLIFYFINDINDLWVYFFVQGTSMLFSQVVLWLFVFKYIDGIQLNFKKAFLHLKPASEYFIGKIAITLYTNLNKTLLGLYSTTIAVGYYSNSIILPTMIAGLIGSIDSVLLPRMSNLFSNKETDKIFAILNSTLHAQLFITIPCYFGILSINNYLVEWFFGPKFHFVSVLIPWMSLIVIIAPISTSIVKQYLMPMNRIKQYNISVILAAVLSIILNIILIPKIEIWGAVVSTIAAEVTVCFVRLIDLYKNTTFRLNYFLVFQYVISAVVMNLSILLVSNLMQSSPLTTIVQILVGIIVYMSITFLLKINPIIRLFKLKELNF